MLHTNWERYRIEYVKAMRGKLAPTDDERAAPAQANKLVDYAISQVNVLRDDLARELAGIAKEINELAMFDPYLCFKWAKLLENLGLLDDAIALRQTFVKLKPIDYYAPENLQKLSSDLKKQGKIAEAAEAQVKLAASYWKDPMAEIAMRDLSGGIAVDEAAAYCRKVLDALPPEAKEKRQAWTLEYLVSAYRKAQRSDDAATACEEAIKIAPAGDWGRRAAIELARINYDRGRGDEAIAACKKLAERYPKSREAVDALLVAAELEAKAQKPDDSRQSYLRVIERYGDTPRLPEAVKGLYEVELDRPDRGRSVEAAVASISELLGRHKGDTRLEKALIWLGVSLEQGGRDDELSALCARLAEQAAAGGELKRWTAARAAKTTVK